MPKKVIFCVVAIFLVFFLIPPVSAQSSLVGLPAMTELEQLPYFKYGIRAKQVSTYNRDINNNGDGSGHCLYEDSTGCVIFDEIGPGVIYQMWMTGTHDGNFKFFFDNESSPRINLPISNFFSGIQPPFLTPLVGNDTVSSGGFYSYIPIPFQTRLKITTPWGPAFYHITYHILTADHATASFTGNEDYTKVKQLWTNVGQDPKSTLGNQTISNPVTLPHGQALTLAEINGAGVIQSLKLTGVSINQPVAEGLKQCRLKIYWDNQTSPAVDVPLGPLFGAYFTYNGIHSLMVGQEPNYYYLYFPMPFWSKAKIVLENNTTLQTLSFTSEIQYKMTAYGENAGYFYATYNEQKPTIQGKDYPYLETTGTGHFVGVIAFMDNPYNASGFSYLEGDERVYFDDNLTPALYGTGTEDYYNGGWYFKFGAFNLPNHGASFVKSPKVTAYRLHLSDSLSFESKIKFGIEHGGVGNNVKADYANVAFYYKKDSPSLILTDQIDIGKATSENTHLYQTTPSTTPVNQACRYVGDEDDTTLLTDDGRAFTNYSEFKTNIAADNQGVRLRRRTDYKLKNQQARVYVDGVLAGLWYSPDNNDKYQMCWQDEIFEIPSQFTQGKTQITVKIVNANPNVVWNEYYYWIYSHVPLVPRITTTPTPDLTQRCDLNNDSFVNEQDIQIIHDRWGTYGLVDVNQDGTTNETDLSICLANWSLNH